jgi:hypothetical protein
LYLLVVEMEVPLVGAFPWFHGAWHARQTFRHGVEPEVATTFEASAPPIVITNIVATTAVTCFAAIAPFVIDWGAHCQAVRGG